MASCRLGDRGLPLLQLASRSSGIVHVLDDFLDPAQNELGTIRRVQRSS